jgi:hypothetical protein
MRIVSPRTARRLALSALAASTVAMLAGCGGERQVNVAGTVLRLRLDEFRITPQLVRVHPGRLKLIAYNTGVLTHNVKIELEHRDAYGQPIVVGGTPTALPGEQVEAKLTLPAGRYLMVDTLANHLDLGQYGTLVVR